MLTCTYLHRHDAPLIVHLLDSFYFFVVVLVAAVVKKITQINH